MGSFPQTTGNKRFAIVGTDYFMKWVEPKALASIQKVDVKKFVWKKYYHKVQDPKNIDFE